MNTPIQGFSLWLLIPLAIILLFQGTWLFTDARQRQINPWFWGIWGLLQVPMPTIFYLIFLRWRQSRMDKEDLHNDHE